MGARLHGLDALQGMPMIGRPYEHDVQVLIGQHFFVIGKGFGLFPRFLALTYQGSRIGEHFLIDITKGYHIDMGHLDQSKKVAFAVPTCSDQADTERLVTVHQIDAVGPEGGKCYRGGSAF